MFKKIKIFCVSTALFFYVPWQNLVKIDLFLLDLYFILYIIFAEHQPRGLQMLFSKSVVCLNKEIESKSPDYKADSRTITLPLVKETVFMLHSHRVNSFHNQIPASSDDFLAAWNNGLSVRARIVSYALPSLSLNSIPFSRCVKDLPSDIPGFLVCCSARKKSWYLWVICHHFFLI